MSTKIETKQLYNISFFSLALISVIKNIYVINQSRILDILELVEWIFYLILVGLYIIRGKFSVKELIIEFVVVVLLLAGYMQSGYAALLKGVLVVIAAKNIDYVKICKTLRYGFSCGFALSVVLYLLGISTVENVRRGYSSLGFISANVCSGILLIIFVTWFIERAREKVRLIDCVIVWIVAILDLRVVNSRMASLLLFLLPCVTVVVNKILKLKNQNKIGKVVKFLICLLPIILLVFTYVTAYIYPYSAFIRSLDSLFSSRFYLNYSNLSRYGVSLFGQSITWNTGEAIYNSFTGYYSTFNTVDNSYMCLLLQMGLIPTLIFIAGEIFAIKKAIKNKLGVLVAVSIIICIYGLTESSVIEIYYNIPLIYMMAESKKEKCKLNLAQDKCN